MRLIYHPDAEAELIEAAQFYERRVSTMGSQFLDAADRAIAVILIYGTGRQCWETGWYHEKSRPKPGR